MMRRTWLVAVLLLGGCAWSNSLYHAGRLANAAERAEREDRAFEAGGYWGQVVAKADSAYARDPEGVRGAEALWLRGRALARLNNCADAIPTLERVGVLAPMADWREAQLLELGRCLDRQGEPRAADVFRPLLQSADSAVRREARRGAGRAYITTERWAEALTALEDLPGPAARIERGIAMAALGRTDDALMELAPIITAADTSVAWHRVLGFLADRDGPDAEALLTRLVTFPGMTPTMEARWRLAVARGTAVHPEAQRNQLEAAARLIGSTAASDARVLLVERRLAEVTAPDELMPVLDGFDALIEGDPTTQNVVRRYMRFADALLEDVDTVRAGAPLGDLAFFHQAEIARDSLGAPRLASWLFRRLESDWGASAYLPKVLLARVMLEPDSAGALRARVARYPQSPYLRYLQGESSPAFRALEDSLRFYLGDRAAAAATRDVRGPAVTEFE